ncbi:response regulator [sulfur-oxidizing endosymbiont of Gigantopelta aegis]|uniref:response regulator n=1 Tax=sulfur-oxidizing endosymbiont of Gigantopelta aegis TaxID=2794934 RepID=UPI0018DE1862|nr:response regulator [sulfur-oxidizing endosymbiont of Gigantopelta aegis]
MNTQQIKILIIDDDPKLGDLLARYLSEQQISAQVVYDGKQMDDVLAVDSFDLIILDIMLPGEDGLSIARRLRKDSSIPIIILSARGEDVEKIIGLEVGADDYLAKPFNPRELLARIRAVLRRPVENASIPEKINKSIRPFGPFKLNLNNHVLLESNKPVELTSGEYDLLEAFVKNANQVLSRDQLIDHLKGYERSPFDRSIDVRVTRLRKKLGNNDYIRTIRGIGYMFITDPLADQ